MGRIKTYITSLYDRYFWHLVLILDLAFMAATLVQAIVAEGTGAPQDRPDGDFVLSAAILFLVFAVIPLKWYKEMVSPKGTWRDTFDWIQLGRFWPAAGIGVGLGVATIITLLGVGWIATQLGVENLRDEPRPLAWATILALSLIVAVYEEVFFRGFLQNYTTWYLQAPIFLVLHLPLDSWLEAGIILALAFLLGYVRQRFGNLWVPIMLHASFNALQLIATRIQHAQA